MHLILKLKVWSFYIVHSVDRFIESCASKLAASRGELRFMIWAATAAVGRTKVGSPDLRFWLVLLLRRSIWSRQVSRAMMSASNSSGSGTATPPLWLCRVHSSNTCSFRHLLVHSRYHQRPPLIIAGFRCLCENVELLVVAVLLQQHAPRPSAEKISFACLFTMRVFLAVFIQSCNDLLLSLERPDTLCCIFPSNGNSGLATQSLRLASTGFVLKRSHLRTPPPRPKCKESRCHG